MYGYGKALYIAHPNGYTTVYGHLQRFSDKIEKIVKAKQYEQRSYEVEIYPYGINVEKGEIVAYSGNTGGSGGPHLHFEFRDTKSEKILNPMAFGFRKIIEDTKNPEIQSVMAYPLGDSTQINKGRVPIALNLSRQADGTFITNRVYASGKIGFAINAYDYLTNRYNKNGLYKVQTFLNGVPYFNYKFDEFSFDESKHINNFIDYKRYSIFKQRMQKLFIKENFPLSIVTHNQKDGFVEVKPGMSYTYKIEVFDFHGNKATVIIPISFKNEVVPPIGSSGKFFIKSKNDYNFEFENSSVYLPPNAFYENFYLNASEENDILNLENNNEAFQHSVTVTLKTNTIDEAKLKKAFVGKLEGNVLEYNSSFRKDNAISAKVKEFGKYKIGFDETPPRIYNPNFIEGSTIKSKVLTLSISDSQSGIEDYQAYLNGEWILMEYEYKTKKLTHYFTDDKVKEGENEFKLIVSDKLGNHSTFTSKFIY